MEAGGQITHFVERVGELVWGPWTVVLLMAAGCWLSMGGGWLQLRVSTWWRATVGELISEVKKSKSIPMSSEKKAGISPFQSVTAALAGTLGTGNIIGVAAAIAVGGPGAIFWMWLTAIPGMMTAYAENVLGILYRKRDEKGQWLGGPMLYMRYGLGAEGLAVFWAALCVLAAFGVGNIVQVNSIAAAVDTAWNIPSGVTGGAVALLAAPAILGGAKGVVRMTEKLVPFMAAFYMLACIGVLAVNAHKIPQALWEIISGAFSPSAAGGGFLGAMLVGVRRGVFTHEAGMGSSVMIHCTAEVDCPARQGMWGMFEVFVDTIIMCTLTALAILTGTPEDIRTQGAKNAAHITAAAFSDIFGGASDSFIAAAMLLFAFATVVGWSCCGERAFGYLFGARTTWIYRLLYVLMIIPGCMFRMDTVWALSDILNGLMAIPNTVAVVLLSKEVKAQGAALCGRARLAFGGAK